MKWTFRFPWEAKSTAKPVASVATEPSQEQTIMAIVPVAATDKQNDEAKSASKQNGFMTFLQNAGNVLKNILHIGEEVAEVAEPIIDLAFPQVAPLYNSALGLAISAEATAPTLTGSGVHKLSQLTANLVPQAQAWAAQNGIKWDDAEISKWASAVVDTLNMIPAPTTPAASK